MTSIDDIVVENNRLNNMKRRIMKLEKENAKSNYYDDASMVKKILKIIEEEIECV